MSNTTTRGNPRLAVSHFEPGIDFARSGFGLVLHRSGVDVDGLFIDVPLNQSKLKMGILLPVFVHSFIHCLSTGKSCVNTTFAHSCGQNMWNVMHLAVQTVDT